MRISIDLIFQNAGIHIIPEDVEEVEEEMLRDLHTLTEEAILKVVDEEDLLLMPQAVVTVDGADQVTTIEIHRVGEDVAGLILKAKGLV